MVEAKSSSKEVISNNNFFHPLDPLSFDEIKFILNVLFVSGIIFSYIIFCLGLNVSIIFSYTDTK